MGICHDVRFTQLAQISVEKGDEIYLSVNFAPLGSTKLSGEKVEEQPKEEP